MLDCMGKPPHIGEINEGRYVGNEWHRTAGAAAKGTGEFLQVPDWEIALGILAWATQRWIFTFAELAANGPQAVRNLAQPELLALLEVMKESWVIQKMGLQDDLGATYCGKLIAGVVTNEQERDAYLGALGFLHAENWEIAFLWTLGAIDLGPAFTFMDVEEEFLLCPMPATIEEKTQTRVIETLLRYGVIEHGGFGRLRFTAAGRAIVRYMEKDVDFMADLESKLPSGTMRAARRERRKRLGRPGAE